MHLNGMRKPRERKSEIAMRVVVVGREKSGVAQFAEVADGIN